MPKKIPTEDLLVTFNYWKEHPSDPYYEQRWISKLEKIISSVLSRSMVMKDHTIEDSDDVKSEALLVLLKASKNAKGSDDDPLTNKKLMNYLKISTKLYLAGRTKKVCRSLDKKRALEDHYTTKDALYNDNHRLHFNLSSDILMEIAQRLANQETKTKIKADLKLNNTQLNKYIDSIKKEIASQMSI